MTVKKQTVTSGKPLRSRYSKSTATKVVAEVKPTNFKAIPPQQEPAPIASTTSIPPVIIRGTVNYEIDVLKVIGAIGKMIFGG